MPEFLLLFSDNPGWLVLAVVISTFMLEDLAIVAAALLASAGQMEPSMAFAAVCVGMFIGDTALYLLGRSAHLWPWLGRKADHPLVAHHIGPLQQAPLHQLALIRCMPGLRTFGYIACGVARVPGAGFTLANLLSILVWAGMLFGVAFWLGSQYAEQLHDALWWLLPPALLLFVLAQRRSRQRLNVSEG
ncbi:MAG: VTT domain-containing protein [Pseudomonadota bacterium]|nr:VTT domain-containing protein [Pseudomonadota bacterium]